MGEHRVLAGETLSSIAKDYNFRNYKTILDAHNEMSVKEYKKYIRITNPNVLIENQTIFIPDSKDKIALQEVGTDGQHCLAPESEQYLRLKIEDPFNEIVSVKDDISLFINGRKIEEVIDDTNYFVQDVLFKEISAKIPIKIAQNNRNYLKLNLTSPLTEKIIEKEINLLVGGLDPIITPEAKNIAKATNNVYAKIAVQKLLVNLGYYQGPFDGDLEKEDSFKAIMNFQLANNIELKDFGDIGKPTLNTLKSLQILQGINADFQIIHYEKITDKSKYRSDLPLFNIRIPVLFNSIMPHPFLLFKGEKYNPVNIAKGWKQKSDFLSLAGYFGYLGATVKINKFNHYVDREQKDIGDTKNINATKTLFDVHQAFVAPTHNLSGDSNVILNKPIQFIFLDVGRWKNDARDFGLVWGRNVYLCSYNRRNIKTKNNKTEDDFKKVKGNFFNEADASRTKGLDIDFFKHFNSEESLGKISIQSVAYMNWGEEKDIDWDYMHIIMPDMHLMSPEVSNIWYRVLDKNEEGHSFLQAERDLFDFVNDLTRKKNKFKGKLKITNIGDVYDLWVGMGTSKIERGEKNIPLFGENKNQKVEFVQNQNPFWAVDFTSGEEIEYENNYSYVYDKMKDIQGLMEHHFDEKAFEKLAKAADEKMKDAESELNKCIKRAMDKQKQFSKENDWFITGAQLMYPVESDYHVVRARKKFDEATNNCDEIKLEKKYWLEKKLDLQQWIKENLEYLKDDSDENLFPKSVKDLKSKKSYYCLNPAEAAMRKLQNEFENDITYIYGNHDSYLASDEFAEFAQLGNYKRVSCARPDEKALFIEHGQRLEAFFGSYLFDSDKKYLFPTNEDGNISGFQATCKVFNNEFDKSLGRGLQGLVKYKEYIRFKDNFIADKADWYAGLHDQYIYRKEFAKFFLGEMLNGTKTPPGIFVIGHTHMPQLVHVKVEGPSNFRQDKGQKSKDETMPIL